jgi:hypothetical protein
MLKYEWSMLEQNSFDIFSVFFFVQAFDLFSYEVMTPLANISCARLQLPNNINGLLAASYEFDNWVSMTKGFITLSY